MRPENHVTDEEIRRSCIGGYGRQCPECDTDMDSSKTDPDSLFPRKFVWTCPECGHKTEPA